MAITATDICDVISIDDDFGHEMRVGRVLRGYLGTSTEHGGTYSDPISGKPRQFDYRWLSEQTFCRVGLAVECKNLNPEAPVLISGTKRLAGEAFHEIVESRKGGRFKTPREVQFHDVAAGGVVRRAKHNQSLYPPEGFVGKSLLQLKPTSGEKDGVRKYARARDAEIYEKWSQALASAVDLVDSAFDFASKGSDPHVFTVVLPVVVVPDGTLWRAEYDHNGSLIGQPSKTEECEFYVSREVARKCRPGDWSSSFTFSHLHFVTLTGFGKFLLRIDQDGNWHDLAFDNHIIRAARAERLP